VRGAGVRAARGLAALALLTAAGAILTATNTVPSTQIGQAGAGIGPDSLKPGACSGISLSATTSGAGAFSGSGASELVSGSGGADTISALGGNDCVVGGGGDDTIDGGPGADVCIGGGGTDAFIDCETEVQ
jgi:hypothetical protein